MRVGDYRIIYTIADDVLLIVVVALGHRRELVVDVTIGIDKVRRHQMLKCGPCTEGDRFLLCPPRSTN